MAEEVFDDKRVGSGLVHPCGDRPADIVQRPGSAFRLCPRRYRFTQVREGDREAGEGFREVGTVAENVAVMGESSGPLLQHALDRLAHRDGSRPVGFADRGPDRDRLHLEVEITGLQRSDLAAAHCRM